MYGEVFNMLWIMGIVMVCVFFVFVLLESFFCYELDYFRNIIEDEFVLEYIEWMCKVLLKIDIIIECCYFEIDIWIV